MDAEEIVTLELGMRALLSEFALDWVRTNIEEGIAAGLQLDVLVDRSVRPEAQVALFDEEEAQYRRLSPDAKGQRMIGNLRLQPADRARLVIKALRRLIVELPEIHEDTIKRLAVVDDGESMAEDIRFFPDEDDTAEAAPGLETVTAPESQAAREAAATFLARLDHEVSQA